MRLRVGSLVILLSFSAPVLGDSLVYPGKLSGRGIVVSERGPDLHFTEAQLNSFSGVTGVVLPVGDLEPAGQLAVITVSADGEVRSTPLMGRDLGGVQALSKSGLTGAVNEFREELTDFERILQAKEQNRVDGLKGVGLTLRAKELTQLIEKGQRLNQQLEKVQRLNSELQQLDQLLAGVEGSM